MKKLIFLLVMAVVLVGFMPAQDAAHPPGDITLEAVQAEYCCVYGDAVAQPADMVLALDNSVKPSDIQAVMANNIIVIRLPERCYITVSRMFIGLEPIFIGGTAGYYLRC